MKWNFDYNNGIRAFFNEHIVERESDLNQAEIVWLIATHRLRRFGPSKPYLNILKAQQDIDFFSKTSSTLASETKEAIAFLRDTPLEIEDLIALVTASTSCRDNQSTASDVRRRVSQLSVHSNPNTASLKASNASNEAGKYQSLFDEHLAFPFLQLVNTATIAEALGVNPSTVKFWRKQLRIEPTSILPRGDYLYSLSKLELFRQVKVRRDAGYSVDDIRTVLEL